MPTYNPNSPIPTTRMGQRLAANGVPVFSGGRDPRVFVGGTQMDPASGQYKPYQQPPQGDRQLGQIAGAVPGGDRQLGQIAGGGFTDTGLRPLPVAPTASISDGYIKNPQFYQGMLGGAHGSGGIWAGPSPGGPDPKRFPGKGDINPRYPGSEGFPMPDGGPIYGGLEPYPVPGNGPPSDIDPRSVPGTGGRGFPGMGGSRGEFLPLQDGGPAGGVGTPGRTGGPPVVGQVPGRDPYQYTGPPTVTQARGDVSPGTLADMAEGWTGVGGGPNYYGAPMGGGDTTGAPPNSQEPGPAPGEEQGPEPTGPPAQPPAGGADWAKIREWRQTIPPELNAQWDAEARALPAGGGARAAFWQQKMEEYAAQQGGGEIDPVESVPPAGPTPYQQKLERRRANRQAKRQARWDRRSGGGGGGGAANAQTGQQFSQALYGDTSIPNEAKNAIQAVHEQYRQGQATQQQLGQAIFNSGLPHALKLRLMQMYGGGQAAPTASPVANTQTASAMRGGRRRGNR